MSRLASVLAALALLAAFADPARALSIEGPLPRGSTVPADVLAQRLASCCGKVGVLVQPWVQRDADLPWNVVTSARVGARGAAELERTCGVIGREARAVFGPGHRFETRLALPDGKVHACAVLLAPLGPTAPPLVVRPDAALSPLLDPALWPWPGAADVLLFPSVVASPPLDVPELPEP